ncbi:3-oxoacyl-ACP reductase FabG [Nonomuraea salmonea]
MEGLRLDGRVAVVTGGAGAIGAAIGADLAALGARVVLADVDLPGASKAAAGLPDARALRVDLAVPESVSAFAAAVGEVHVLVHNAGVSIVRPFTESDPADWELMWRVNLRGPMLLTRLLLPGMTAGDGDGWCSSPPTARGPARAARARTRPPRPGCSAWPRHWPGRPPGRTSPPTWCARAPPTPPMLRRVAEAEPGLVDKIARGIPLRRLGSPADVAGLVAYLCTERAAYITGQILSVSGGVTMH